jgi:hypothetical protein
MRLLTFFPMLLVAAVLLAGCGSSNDDSGSAQPTAPPTKRSSVYVDEAVTAGRGGPLLVRGYLLVENGRVRLCSGFAESYPPQCVQPWLDVPGYKLRGQQHIYKAHSGVTWTEEPVQLLGTIDDGRLTVSKNAAR